MHQVKIHHVVKKHLKRSPFKVRQAFECIITELQYNPYPPHLKIKKLHKPQNSYRYKMYPYRISYTIDKKRKIVYIYDFFHRGRGYR